jgi:tetratricopeptide (TPR) repeat protein
MQALLVGAALLSGCLLSVPAAAQDWGGLNALPSNRLPSPQRATQTVSADLLRHPVSSKTRRMLQRAVDWMRSGKHQEAIRQLEDTLAKDPSSAAYVHSLLGFEYMKTDQFSAAVNCFEQAIALLPHDATNHQKRGCFDLRLVTLRNASMQGWAQKWAHSIGCKLDRRELFAGLFKGVEQLLKLGLVGSHGLGGTRKLYEHVSTWGLDNRTQETVA